MTRVTLKVIPRGRALPGSPDAGPWRARLHESTYLHYLANMEKDDNRLVSQITRNTMALVLAGGRGSRLEQLTEWRAKPAVPFGGKFRIIDFALSNCLNSGLRRIGVVTQYKSHSLLRHLQRG